MILVIGDVIVDEYIHGRVTRISPEAPVPVIDFTFREFRPGGAANVAANVSSLGEPATLVGVVGKDFPLDRSSEWYLFQDAERPTTLKTRVVANGQQIVRVDIENRHPISGATERDVLEFISITMAYSKLVVLSDYAKGVVTERVARHTIHQARQYGIPVIVDPKQEDFGIYEGATLLTPNRMEFARSTNHSIDATILVTLGEEGMELHHKGDIAHIPAEPIEVVDVTGAGDTVVAALAVFIARNPQASIREAAQFASYAASVAVSRQGTATVTLQDIAEHFGK